MLEKINCRKCSTSYNEYQAYVNNVVHGPGEDYLRLWRRRGETSFSSPSSHNLLYLNDKLDVLHTGLAKSIYEFIHEVKEAVVLRLLGEQISIETFSEVAQRMFVGRVLCDLDYNNIINQCAFIICNLVDKVHDAVDMFIRMHETMFHALATGDTINNLCAGPNIEGNVFKKCYELVLKRNIRIVAIDINCWDYGFDKCERVVKEVVESDIIATNMMFHGIKYLDWLCSKTEDEMVEFLGKRVIFSVEHFSVQRHSNLSFYSFVGEASVSKGVLCSWRGIYAFMFIRMQAYRKYHIVVLVPTMSTATPYFSRVEAICYCVETTHNCRYNSIVHDIICMQEAAIEGCESDKVRQWYVAKHQSLAPYIDIDNGNIVEKVSRHRECPLECRRDSGHYNNEFLLKGKIHEHLSCVYLGYNCASDSEFYGTINDILGGDLTKRKSNRCNVFSTANRVKQAQNEQYLPIPRLSWAMLVDFYDDDANPIELKSTEMRENVVNEYKITVDVEPTSDVIVMDDNSNSYENQVTNRPTPIMIDIPTMYPKKHKKRHKEKNSNSSNGSNYNNAIASISNNNNNNNTNRSSNFSDGTRNHNSIDPGGTVDPNTKHHSRVSSSRRRLMREATGGMPPLISTEIANRAARASLESRSNIKSVRGNIASGITSVSVSNRNVISNKDRNK